MPAIGRVILLLLVVTAKASAQTPGNLSGCVTDSSGRPKPGANVSVTALGRKVTTSTNNDGCYDFTALPPGVYRITARLKGFDNLTRDKITVSSGRLPRVDFTMTTGPICDCQPPGKTLEQLADVDAIVYVRIIGPGTDAASERGYFKQTANVLQVLKHRSRDLSGDRSLTFLQDQSNGAPEPYEPGEEFVLFLHWFPSQQLFTARTRHSTDGSDRETVFVIPRPPYYTFTAVSRSLHGPAGRIASGRIAPIGTVEPTLGVPWIINRG